MLVPTVDTLRYPFMLNTLVRAGKHTMLTGSVGVGKTSIVASCLGALDDSFATASMNFSARTSATRVSGAIEARPTHARHLIIGIMAVVVIHSSCLARGEQARVEKRTKDTWAPPGGKRLVYFIDDFSMPMKARYTPRCARDHFAEMRPR